MSRQVVESIVVASDPQRLYDLVTDVTRMGEYSPEATGARGVPDHPLGVGDRFVGTNKRGPIVWLTQCTVRVADPGVAFVFDVDAGPVPVSRWRYDFRPTGDGTEIVETWIDRRTGPLGLPMRAFGRLLIPEDRAVHNRRNMQATLAAIKAKAENG